MLSQSWFSGRCGTVLGECSKFLAGHTRTVETVPTYVAWLFWPQLTPVQQQLLESCGRELGMRVEIDLASVAAALGDSAADDLYAHYLRCKQGGAGTVRMYRCLHHAAQRTAKKQRADLTDELAALDSLPGVADFVAEFTGPSPDGQRLAVLGSPFHAATRVDSRSGVARLAVDSRLDWVPLLGGPASPGERRRIVELSARYAAWRDRRVRRLSEVRVLAEEHWPAAPPGLAAHWRFAQQEVSV